MPVLQNWDVCEEIVSELQKSQNRFNYLNANIFVEVPGGKNVIVTGAANRNIELISNFRQQKHWIRTKHRNLFVAEDNSSNHNLVTGGESQCE